MSAILAEVRCLALIGVLVLTGCGAANGHHTDWRTGADGACFEARDLLAPLSPPSSFSSAELVAGAVALALRQELDRTARLGAPPATAVRGAEQLRRARRAMLVVLLGEIRAARAHDLGGVQNAIRRLTTLSRLMASAALAAGLRICGHELDRGIAELPA